jgi:protocatechuate 3,4-dioxygenase beta subunit
MNRKLLAIPIAVALGLLWWQWRGSSDEATSNESTATASGETGPGSREADPAKAATGHSSTPAIPSGQMRVRGRVPAVAVTGRVVSRRSKRSVPYVDVVFRRGRQEATTTSDDSGDFEIQLEAGTYEIRAVGDGVLADRVQTLALRSEARIEVEVVDLAAVMGTVRYDDGRPASEIEVGVRVEGSKVRSYLETGEIAPALTDSSGNFEIMLPPGSHVLRAQDSATDAFVEVANLKAGEEREGVSIVLDRSARLSGRVVSPQGKSMTGAEVTISAQIPGTGQYDRKTLHSDKSGRFALDGIRPGTYVVEATFWGYAPSPPQRIALKHGQSRANIKLKLTPPLRLAGQVVDSEGQPLPEVEIAHVWEGSRRRYSKTSTNDAGRFAFSSVGAGPHMVRARKPGYVLARLHNVPAPNEAVNITMHAAASVRGQVLSAGRPVSEFEIEVKQGRARRDVAFRDEQGRFEIPDLAAQETRLVVRTAGRSPHSVDAFELKPGQELSLQLELDK